MSGRAREAEQAAETARRLTSPTRPIGRNTATVVRVEDVTAPATSLTAVRIGLRALLAVAEVPLDVLQDHDRVVDDAADGDGERAEGQHVERVGRASTARSAPATTDSGIEIAVTRVERTDGRKTRMTRTA